MEAVDRRGAVTLLAAARRVVLTTHLGPDGDGIGSEIALAGLVRSVGGGSEMLKIVNHDPVPESLGFLDPASSVETYAESRHAEAIRGADLVVGLDNSVPRRLGGLEPHVFEGGAKTLCIDHHPDPDRVWDVAYVDDSASSTGQIVHELFVAADRTPDPVAATAIYTALVTDTGRFRFRNTTAEAFDAAAAVVRAGARPAEACSAIEERLKPSFLGFIGALLGALEQRAGGRLLILRAPLDMQGPFDLTGIDMGEAINFALRTEPSRVAALFRELEDGRTKVSLRSKGTLDVNAVARLHGGGGHTNASGIVIESPLDRAAEALIPALEALAEKDGGGDGGGA